MGMVRRALAAALLIAAARPAEASTALGPEAHLVRHVTLGARFGAILLADPSRVGAALDGRLRIRGSQVYAEGLVGPWLVFRDGGDRLRMHAAFGFGLLARSLSFGIEVGWLDPTSMIGVRLAFPL